MGRDVACNVCILWGAIGDVACNVCTSVGAVRDVACNVCTSGAVQETLHATSVRHACNVCTSCMQRLYSRPKLFTVSEKYYFEHNHFILVINGVKFNLNYNALSI